VSLNLSRGYDKISSKLLIYHQNLFSSVYVIYLYRNNSNQ